MAEGGEEGACLLTVAVRLLLDIKTAQHVLECACSVRTSYCQSSGRHMQRCERTARVGSREGAYRGFATSAVVMWRRGEVRACLPLLYGCYSVSRLHSTS